LTASAMGVVLLQNIVYAAFLLGACFISVAGLYLLLNADFVAAAQVLIYVGAVNILILFAIMLVNKRQDYQDVKFGAIRSVVTGVVCLGLFALLGVTVTSTKWAITSNIAKLPSTLLVIGQHFFSDYLLPFELASVLLLVALIGAIVLARREFIPDTVKSQADSEESLELLEKPKEQLVSSK
ncbi:MAG: NADH-quinone oxidoreductase subunit J, partial [Pseudanabaena sp.]